MALFLSFRARVLHRERAAVHQADARTSGTTPRSMRMHACGLVHIFIIYDAVYTEAVARHPIHTAGARGYIVMHDRTMEMWFWDFKEGTDRVGG